MDKKEFKKDFDYHLNKVVSKCMRFTLFILTLVFLLNTFNIFKVDKNIALINFLFSIFFLITPTVIVDILNIRARWVKYVNISLSCIAIGIYYSLLTYNTILLFIFPLLLASLFFNKKLNIYTIIFSIISFTIGHIVSYYLKINPYTIDKTLSYVITFGLIPRIFEYIALSYICTSNSNSTYKILNKLFESTSDQRKRQATLNRLIKGSASLFSSRNYTEIASAIVTEIKDTYSLLIEDNIPCKCCVAIKTSNDTFYRIDESYKPSTVKNDGLYVYDSLNKNYKFNLFNSNSSISYDDNIIIKYYDNNILLAYIIIENKIDKDNETITSLFNTLYSNILLGIKNANLSQELFQTQEEIIFSLAEISESKSAETGMHIKRVYEYTRVMAKAINCNKRDEDNFALASMMHDIGKLLIPTEILEKPGKLTEDEFNIIKTHVTVGYNLLKNSPGTVKNLAKNIALMHHEKWDGTGYLGMKGEEIDYYARIVAVIDVFDALVSDRCYKKAWTTTEAYNEIISQSGKQFDPQVVELFKINFSKLVAVLEKYPDKKSIDTNISFKK